MAFNPQIKKRILHDKDTGVRLPCVMCGASYPLSVAVHIIDQKEWRKNTDGCDRQVNGIPMCPNCHKIFEEHLRPYLYQALEAFGAKGLPQSWKQSNKIGKLPTDEEI